MDDVISKWLIVRYHQMNSIPIIREACLALGQYIVSKSQSFWGTSVSWKTVWRPPSRRLEALWIHDNAEHFTYGIIVEQEAGNSIRASWGFTSAKLYVSMSGVLSSDWEPGGSNLADSRCISSFFMSAFQSWKLMK